MKAVDLVAGSVFTLPSGATHTAVQVNKLSHKVTVFTAAGERVSLFPSVRVTVPVLA